MLLKKTYLTLPKQFFSCTNFINIFTAFVITFIINTYNTIYQQLVTYKNYSIPTNPIVGVAGFITKSHKVSDIILARETKQVDFILKEQA